MTNPKKNPVKSGPEAQIILFFNQKGGCGKSQSAMQIGASLALRGFKTLVVDMDKQSTATMWSSRAKDKPFPATVVSLAAQSENAIGELRKLASLFDFILVDCRPSLEDHATWVMLHVADAGIIPVIPSIDNIWPAMEAKVKGLEAKKKNPYLKLFFLPSAVGRGKVFDFGIELMQEDEDINTFHSYFSERNSFKECALFGASVHNLGSRAKAAAQDVEAVTDELLVRLASEDGSIEADRQVAKEAVGA